MTMKRSPLSAPLTRRTFLGALGIGAAASSVSGLLAPGSAIAQRSRSRTPRFVIREDRFGGCSQVSGRSRTRAADFRPP